MDCAVMAVLGAADGGVSGRRKISEEKFPRKNAKIVRENATEFDCDGSETLGE